MAGNRSHKLEKPLSTGLTILTSAQIQQPVLRLAGTLFQEHEKLEEYLVFYKWRTDSHPKLDANTIGGARMPPL